MSIGLACLFLALVCGLAAGGTLPLIIPALYIAASVAAGVAYAIDKSAAQSGAWRTRERTLHVLALLGDPATHDGERVRRIDTHAASVFLAGERAYKIKRAVTFPFLDYSSVGRRKAA